MDLLQLLRDGFVADDLADALLELGRDDLVDALGTKADLAQRLVDLQLPARDVLSAFYDLAISNACRKFGLPIGTKSENITNLTALLQKSGTRAGG